MLKTRRSGLVILLSLVTVLALSCGAWAATAVVPADGISVVSTDQVYSIVVPNGTDYGLWARNAGSIDITADIDNTATPNGQTYSVLAQSFANVKLTGSITMNGSDTFCFQAANNATGTMAGPVTILDGYFIRAFHAYINGNITTTGNLDILSGNRMRGLYAHTNSRLTATGDVTIHADNSTGVFAHTNSYVKLIGNLLVSGDIDFDDVTSEELMGAGVFAYWNSSVDVTGNVTVTGNGAYGLLVLIGDNTVNLSEGTLTVSGDDTTWAIGILGDGGSSVILSEVTANAENDNLLVNDGSGELNATNNSALNGDVLHDGTAAGTLEVNLTDSAWTGSAETLGDIGQIDVTLTGSNWNVTGDSDTNGTLTGDGTSKVDFNGTDETITVEVDGLKGDPGIDMKVGDTLIIKNSDGSITDIESSNPGVVEVIVDSVTGEITIISKGDGDAEITYTDGDGKHTIGVTSGAGSRATSYGGGSSGCNAGMGASALLSLLGLSLVYKRK